MSQAKVDRYKEEKANRKKTMKKEKFKNAVGAICGTVIGVAVVGWIGYSAYGYFRDQDNNSSTVQTEVDFDAVNDYMSSLPTSDSAGE